MKRSAILGFVGVGATIGILIPFAAHQRSSAAVLEPLPTAKKTPLFPTRELAELDRVVQARFAVVPRDGNFGYSRVELPREIHGYFSPNSKAEKAAVSAMAKRKQDVVFALVGRQRFAGRSVENGGFRGPLVLTSPFYTGSLKTRAAVIEANVAINKITKNAPSAKELIPLADEVFAQAKPENGKRKQIGGWKVVACPVPASSQACVTCHNSMAKAAAKQPDWKGGKPDLVSLHDPLGVALYCVRTAPKTQIAARQTAN